MFRKANAIILKVFVGIVKLWEAVGGQVDSRKIAYLAWPRSSNIRNGDPWAEEKFHLFAVLTKVLSPVRFFKTMLD